MELTETQYGKYLQRNYLQMLTAGCIALKYLRVMSSVGPIIRSFAVEM